MSHPESWPYALSASIKQFIYFHFRVFDLFQSLVLFFKMVGISFWQPVCKKNIGVTNSRGLYNRPVMGPVILERELWEERGLALGQLSSWEKHDIWFIGI